MQLTPDIVVERHVDDVEDVQLSAPAATLAQVGDDKEEQKASTFCTKPRIALAIFAVFALFVVIALGAVWATALPVAHVVVDDGGSVEILPADDASIIPPYHPYPMTPLAALAAPDTTTNAVTTSNMDILQSTTTCSPTTGTNSVTNLRYYVVASSVQGDTVARGGSVSALVVCRDGAENIWAYITDSNNNKLIEFETRTCAWNAKAGRYQYRFWFELPTNSDLKDYVWYQFTVQSGTFQSDSNDYNYAKALLYNCHIGSFYVINNGGSCTTHAQCGSSQQCTTNGVCTIPQYLPSWTTGCQWSGVSPSGCDSPGQIHTVNQCSTRGTNINPTYCTEPPNPTTTAPQSCAKPTCANGLTCNTGTTITNKYGGVDYTAKGWCGAITTSTNVCTPGDYCSDGSFCVGSFRCVARCTVNSDCSAGHTCQNKQCVSTQCLNSMQCPTDAFCTNNQCVQRTACTTDSQCPTNDYCSGGYCGAKSCTTNSNCPSGSICDNGFCYVGNCASDAACLSTQQCTNRQCVARTTCSTDSQCASTHRCSNSQCVVRECTTDAQCTAPKFCSGGACLWRTCSATNTCPTGQVCDAGFCEVGSCTADSQCLSTQQCTNRQCVTRTTCSTHSQCASNQVCASGTCKVGNCVTNADCSSTEQCTNNQCVAKPECTNDSQCEAEKYCTSSGSCAWRTCATTTDCPSGQVCYGGYCEVGNCAKDSDCLSTQQCVAHQCVAKAGSCTSHSQCGTGKWCNDQQQCVDKTYSWDSRDGTCKEGLITRGCNAPKFQTPTWSCVDQIGRSADSTYCTRQGDAQPAAQSPRECNEKVGGCGMWEYCWTGYTDYQTYNGVVTVDVRGKCQQSSDGSNDATHHHALPFLVTLMLAVVVCLFIA